MYDRYWHIELEIGIAHYCIFPPNIYFSKDYNVIYSEILKVGNRPGHQEPRKVKRRPKRFQLLQTPRQFYKKAA